MKKNGNNLEQDLAVMIMELCNVQTGPDMSNITEQPLIGPKSPFGLDSLDAVEIVVAVQKRYQVRLPPGEKSRTAMKNIRALADFIRENTA